MMSLPVYVVNFDDLVREISIEGTEINIDTSNAEEILNQYFPEIIKILENINVADKEIAGVQKIKGFVSKGEKIVFRPDKDIFITGFSFSQNVFSCLDTWNVKVTNGESSFAVLENIYAKENLQHKYLDKFYTVPVGYSIIIQPSNSEDIEKVFWVDLEYIEREGKENGTN